MRYWSREDTRDWVYQVQLRIEDIHYYLKETTKYCQKHLIYENHDVLVLSIMTCIWVSSMRNELITLSEVVDILGLDYLEIQSDKTYDLNKEMSGLDFEQMLGIVSKKGPFLGLDRET